MRFQILTLASAVLTAASPVAQATVDPVSALPSPPDIYSAGNIEQRVDSVVTAAGQTLAKVQQLKGGMNIQIIGPAIVEHFGKLSEKNAAGSVVFNIIPAYDYSIEEQQKICASYEQLLTLEYQIVKALFDHAKLTTGTNFQGHLHAQLRVFQGSIDKYNKGLVKQLPVCADDVQNEYIKLAATTQLAVSLI
ncbi:unnamed protein product [Clonostachys rhizophaga]|uniref:Uncharacterized protein n=1 Tax=Clonostachys rhizophaga TaxID=160324 RepID=A0A9N9YMB8_9HYPO|nr:unnamed protein product [Clonostachys rhizophaga]